MFQTKFQPAPQDTEAQKIFDQIPSELLHLLAETGFVATMCGLWAHESDIFNGIRAVRPNNENPIVSQALARMMVGDFSNAATLLQDTALQMNPENAMAQSFLAMALKRSGRNNEAQQLIESIVKEDRDPHAVQLAQAILTDPI
jgi:thioredoxin-like negative regulator of GroEL